MARAAIAMPGTWPKWRLLAALGGVGAMVAALLAGLALAVFTALAPIAGETVGDSPASPSLQGDALRDEIAAALMLQVPPDAASSPEVATRVGPSLSLPAATEIGPAGVATGFSHTPEGAVAQLGAIEVRVVNAMSVPVAHDVYAAWALPGGVGADGWEMTTNVHAFLTSAGAQSDTKDDAVLVEATTAAGQVKGSDGPDWVVACVLLDVRAAIATDARMGFGHCERMQWTGERWMIAPGTPPATAPSTWPGSDLSIQAGWRTVATA